VVVSKNVVSFLWGTESSNRSSSSGESVSLPELLSRVENPLRRPHDRHRDLRKGLPKHRRGPPPAAIRIDTSGYRRDRSTSPVTLAILAGFRPVVSPLTARR
jgi:hypothetical protein